MTSREYNDSVDSYSDNLFRFILKSIRDEDHAKDVVQEAYTRMWLKHEEIQAEKAKSYLFTTAYHCMIDDIRKNKRIEKMDDNTEVKFEGEEGYSDLSEILQHACTKLPEVQKSAILLRDYEGYSYKEIGEILNLSEPQVKVYIYRARKFLKEYIGQKENVI